MKHGGKTREPLAHAAALFSRRFVGLSYVTRSGWPIIMKIRKRRYNLRVGRELIFHNSARALILVERANKQNNVQQLEFEF